MKRRTLFWKLFPSFLLIAITSIIALSVIAYKSYESFYLEQKASDLKKRGMSFAQIIEAQNQELGLGSLQDRAEKIGREFETRITLIDATGKVLADSSSNPENMNNHLSRPEIASSLKFGSGQSVRYSETLQKKFMYVALNLEVTNGIFQYIRVAIPLDKINGALGEIYKQAGFGAIFLAIFMGTTGYFLSLSLCKPIEVMKNKALRIAEGEFDQKILLSNSAPIEHNQLAEAINTISVQLKKKIEIISLQAQEQEAIFANMTEGILAIDLSGKIFTINNSAKEILGLQNLNLDEAIFHQIVRNQDLSKMVNQALESELPLGREILLDQEMTRYLYFQTTPIKDGNNKRTGLILVINDMTKLKELERHRKDFVANVSHELRTPLTSIQGFSETLIDPKFDDPKAQREFLEIINFQANRLSAIFEDLLTLSKVERNLETDKKQMRESKIAPCIKECLELYKEKFAEKNIGIATNIDADISLEFNESLIMSALGNLVENAIKYSPENTKITVEVTVESGQVKIEVVDEGPGIPAEHLPRIFERFYRVDHARSRKLGGTGLGLAIVKHIALAHNGSVNVTSEVGSGCKFQIFLPLS